MRNYILRRLMLMVPTFIGVTFVVFMLCQFVPGGPIDQAIMRMKGAGGGGEAGSGGGGQTAAQRKFSDAELEAMKKLYGFDKPLIVRYADYLKNLAKLDLGKSFRYSNLTAIDLIKQRLPVSLYYGLITTLLVYCVCIPLGILKALKHRTMIDNATSFVIFIGYAVPGFALGAVLLSVLSVQYGWFPLAGFKSDKFETLSTMGKIADLARHSALPLTCYMIGSFASMTMLMKNSLMENISADYVKTALSKGMSWPRAVFVHALRNSLIPLATSFGNNISLIFTGSLLIERVFNIQGYGLLFFEAVTQRDYPVVMGCTVLTTIFLMVGNLLSDICVALVDPRVRFD